jgi:hypothetical protein
MADDENSLIKALISGMLGLVIATIGTDPISGQPRYTMGLTELFDGVAFMPALIGMLSIGQMLDMAGEKCIVTDTTTLQKIKRETFPNGLKKLINLGCATGTLVGILPGEGATIAAFLGRHYIAVSAAGAADRQAAQESKTGKRGGVLRTGQSAFGAILIPTSDIGQKAMTISSVFKRKVGIEKEIESFLAVIGMGLIKGGRAIRWRMVGGIACGWVATPVLAGLVSFICLFIAQNVFLQTVRL